MSAGFKDHFSGHAAQYAEARPIYPHSLAQVLAERVERRGMALDCGCGSGQLSLLLADHFERVVATDASAEQIANAFQHPRVTYRVAPAERSGVPDGSADLVAAAQAAHWFDLPAFWREVTRVARPGGLVALVSYGLLKIADDLDPLIDDLYHSTLETYWPPERQIVESGYRFIDFPFEELPAPAVEMTTQWSLPQLIHYLSTWSAIKAMEKATGGSPLPDLTERLTVRWGPPNRKRLVRWPLALRLGRAGQPTKP
ncbi:MAG: class I SAM-dependent methyltransferase [Rhodospirillaceae bacterium]|nr:class I SAM-dependent methyltransferase [Rhodospirillaceae bacterium]